MFTFSLYVFCSVTVSQSALVFCLHHRFSLSVIFSITNVLFLPHVRLFLISIIITSKPIFGQQYCSEIKADLENVSVLQLVPSARFCFDVQQSGGDEVKEGIYVSPEETSEMPGGRGRSELRYEIPWYEQRMFNINFGST